MNQKNEWGHARRASIIIADIIVFNLAILLSFVFKFGFDIPKVNFTAYEHSFLYISLFFLLINLLLGVYVFYNKKASDIIITTIIGQILTVLASMVISFMGRWFTFPRSVLGYSLLSSIVLLCISRLIIYFLYLRLSNVKRIVIVGDKDASLNAVKNFVNEKNQKHKVTDVILSNYFENLTKVIDQVDIVYFASQINSKERLAIYDLALKKEKKLFLNAKFENLLLIKPNMMNFEDESVIEISNFKMSSENNFFKRIFDICVAASLLIIASPIMLITCLLIKLTSKGPIVYKQTRITLNQKEFDILKFRTMSTTAEAKSGPVLATTNDSRVTPIGKYLRALRIDELPQLVNVLKGDMSIIGPRPERPFFVEQFKAENPHYYLRHNVRAGITGYAQVYGKYASDYNSKLNFDLLYIKNYSLILDVKILLQTIKILFDKVSSQGVEEDLRDFQIEKNQINVLK